MELSRESNLEISIKELSHIFPFFILISNQLKLEFYGKSNYHLYPNLQKNDDFFTHWEIIRPWVETCNAETIETLTGKLVVIANRSKPTLKFKGQFEKIKLENKYIFIGSPWFNDSDQLIENNLSIGDFAFHDSTIDLLHVLKNNEIANNELKETIQKVNEQKVKISQANEQLKLFRNLIDNSSDSIQVSDESGQLVYINNTASERLGIQADKCHEFNVRQFEKTLSEEEVWQKHVDELKSKTQLVIESENENLITGEHFYVEVYVNYFKLQEQGYIIANSRDISQRKRNEKQLKLQEEKYQNIIANMNLGLLEVDLDENIEFCNQSFTDISGYKLEELKGKNASSLFIDQKLKPEVNQSKEKRKKGISDSNEILVLNKAKEPKWWLISGSPKYDQTGKIIGSIGIHLDITKQKKLEQELEKALSDAQQASKAKEAFLTNMSHEIRTPLNGIIGMIRELDKEEKTAQQKSYIDSAKTASKHLLSMVNNILDLSKIEAGELILIEEEINFHSIIKDIQKIVSNHTKEKGLKLEVKISPKINKSLTGDKTRIQQIILNILNNSIKFTEEGFVKIECNLLKSENEKQIIRVKITDSGIGMKNEYIPKLFTKFQQEDSSTSRMYGGSGLGMVITKQLIDLLNGEITVKSKKNIGTEITLELPFNLFKGESILPLKNQQNSKTLKNLKILIVEDNEMNRMVAKNALTLFEPEITEAENGKEAVSILENKPFDIILMDLQMPIMGGLEATKIIRNKLNISTPIIALSANAFKTEIEKCLSNGMNSYVTKPFEEKDLIEAICKEIGVSTFPRIPKRKKSLFNDKNTLYSTENLMKSSDNDVEFTQKMLKLFVQITPDLIVKLDNAFLQKDISTIKKTAHYIKPTIDNLGIKTLKEDIRKLEALNDDFNKNINLATLIDKVKTTLTTVVQEINENEFQ
jgi:PAS domain S-box-containing protein